jgi:hypothetical protein
VRWRAARAPWKPQGEWPGLPGDGATSRQTDGQFWCSERIRGPSAHGRRTTAPPGTLAHSVPSRKVFCAFLGLCCNCLMDSGLGRGQLAAIAGDCGKAPDMALKTSRGAWNYSISTPARAGAVGRQGRAGCPRPRSPITAGRLDGGNGAVMFFLDIWRGAVRIVAGLGE